MAVEGNLKVTHGARGAQRQVVHLLGERSHERGGMEGQTGLDGRSRSDHSTLRPGRGTHVGKKEGQRFEISIPIFIHHINPFIFLDSKHAQLCCTSRRWNYSTRQAGAKQELIYLDILSVAQSRWEHNRFTRKGRIFRVY